ncbi:hypothetical protein NDU88_004954 [Pleurodeles waltl]|uniref:Uncharacterized protein n=1 Tax=Pleurodeles waltl TaxID=8319 RepID=A0AAV7WBA4_PLEWA|nr:hypothetical protein NDU88_004954 [Pleurodeles waltl]
MGAKEHREQRRTKDAVRELQTTTQHARPATPAQGTAVDRKLQEITAVGRRLEGMDSTICMLAAETKSIRLDIAGFQIRVAGLEQRVSLMENNLNTAPDRDHEIITLGSKLIELEDRSCRDNVHFFSFPEQLEGWDIQAFLCSTLPTLTGLTFEPPLEFQRAHWSGIAATG